MVSHLGVMELQLPYEITQCYLRQVNAPCHNLSQTYLPQREGRLSWS